MILLDANVLVYAFRSDLSSHARCKDWLESVINSREPYGVIPQVLATVVRICTHQRVFVRPSGLPEVLLFCRMLLSQPNAVLVQSGAQHWPVFESVCESFGTVGDDVQLAWYAALAVESNGEWVTMDRHYGRFKQVL